MFNFARGSPARDSVPNVGRRPASDHTGAHVISRVHVTNLVLALLGMALVVVALWIG